MIFDKPNIKSSWASSAWAQHDLVERFLDRFIPVASAVIHLGLIPIFPPLEPGGDYWDTAFLKSSLESMKRRGKTDILDKLVLSAAGSFSNHGLSWGAGGPERWPGSRPYNIFRYRRRPMWIYAFTNGTTPYVKRLYSEPFPMFTNTGWRKRRRIHRNRKIIFQFFNC